MSSSHHSEIAALFGFTFLVPGLSLQVTSHHEAIRVEANGLVGTLKVSCAHFPPISCCYLIFDFYRLLALVPALKSFKIMGVFVFVCLFVLTSILTLLLGRLFGVSGLR